MKTKEELRKEIELLQNEVEKIQKKELKQKLPDYKKLIGTYWKTKNNYACPNKPSDYWNLYIKVVEVDNNGDLYTAKVQIDQYGHLSVEPKVYSYSAQTFDGRYSKSSKAEWDRAINRSLKLIGDL